MEGEVGIVEALGSRRKARWGDNVIMKLARRQWHQRLADDRSFTPQAARFISMRLA
jgi:hypothetical protein